MLKNVVETEIRGRDRSGAAYRSAARNAEAFKTRMQGVSRALGALGIGVGLTIAVQKIRQTFSAMREEGDQIAKTARRIGIASDTLQEFGYHGRLAGIQTGVLNKSLQILQRNLFDISKGAGQDAERAFEALGIGIYDSTGQLRSAKDVVMEVAAILPRMNNETERAGALMKIFGRGGAMLGTFFEGGPDAIKASAEELRKLNGVMTEDQLKTMEDWTDATERLSMAWKGFRNEALSGVAGDLAQISDNMAQNAAATTDWWSRTKNVLREVGLYTKDQEAGFTAAQKGVKYDFTQRGRSSPTGRGTAAVVGGEIMMPGFNVLNAMGNHAAQQGYGPVGYGSLGYPWIPGIGATAGFPSPLMMGPGGGTMEEWARSSLFEPKAGLGAGAEGVPTAMQNYVDQLPEATDNIKDFQITAKEATKATDDMVAGTIASTAATTGITSAFDALTGKTVELSAVMSDAAKRIAQSVTSNLISEALASVGNPLKMAQLPFTFGPPGTGKGMWAPEYLKRPRPPLRG